MLADTSWVWRQYDHMLFLNTVVGPGGDATVLRLKHPVTGEDTGRALALTTDGNHRWCAVDPRIGTAWVVAESVLNLACVGARPLAVVNCLNFGNPEHPEVMWELSEAIDGMADACRALGLPVVGGNVSLYNESHGIDIDPTPVIGVLGVVDDLDPPAAGHGAGRRRRRCCVVGPEPATPRRSPARDGRGSAGARGGSSPSARPGDPPRRGGVRAGRSWSTDWWPPSTTWPRAGWRWRWPRQRWPARWAREVTGVGGARRAVRRVAVAGAGCASPPSDVRGGAPARPTTPVWHLRAHRPRRGDRLVVHGRPRCRPGPTLPRRWQDRLPRRVREGDAPTRRRDAWLHCRQRPLL